MFKNVRNYDQKDISGCAISGIMSEAGRRFRGDMIIQSIANMHDRSNGLGGGFAAYGIYPDFRDQYAFQVMFERPKAREETKAFLREWCLIRHDEPIPIRSLDVIRNRPILHRYFIDLKPELFERYYDMTEEDIVVKIVMQINREIEGAFVFSSGKNMGVFKGVGFPEDIGEFYRLDEYEGYLWTAHGRFPTNTTGWWGGAHPFGLLDWAVVHNGEISSYGANRRYLMDYGYYCTLHTDTEVITYLFDLLFRKHRLPLDIACMALAPPFWDEIERMDENRRKIAKAVRMSYGGALLNGPFSVVVSCHGRMIGFNDRIKLRPMAAGRKDDMVFIASEEAAIRVVCKNPDVVWQAKGGVPIIGELKEKNVA